LDTTHGAGGTDDPAELDPDAVELEAADDGGRDALLLVPGLWVDGAGWVSESDPVGVPPAADGLPGSLEKTTCTVRASSTTIAITVASSIRRRRQYTDGGWDPTG
jgi:hypothetical protein